mmetsp:Transcript_107946/g.240933  ORF Transcript_107946/g.240933 Transcript_107946/m.240933 type:complete len:410 (-) Transcript_107946:47-1276(-)
MTIVGRVPGASGGVRGDVPWDAPPAFPERAATGSPVVAAAFAGNDAPAVPSPGPQLRTAMELDEAERELWRQLRRKRDFEGRVAEKRAQLAEIRDKRRGVSAARAEMAVSVEHLSAELDFARQQRREVEHDIAVLKESNRILQSTSQGDASKCTSAPSDLKRDAKDILAEERTRREALQVQDEQIAHLRSHLERLRTEKASLQQRQQVLFERQRAAEQDRNRLIGALQDDRSGINELRSERIRLWEDRTSMERELTQIAHEVRSSAGADGTGLGSSPGSPGSAVRASRSAWPAGTGSEAVVPATGLSGGVRGDVVWDAPLAFSSASAPPWSSDSGGREGALRPHWTHFESGGAETGGLSGGSGGVFLNSATRPPSFGGALEAPPSADLGDVTEWSGRLRDFRTHSEGPP